MKKTTGILLALACFFAGTFLGFLVSPAKQGFGNNSGNTNNYYGHKKDDDNPAK